MKKSNLFKVVALAMISMFLLVGCGKEVTETYTQTLQPGVESKLTYTAKGDVVQKQSSETVVDYAKSGLTEDSIKNSIKTEVDKYKNVKGLDHKIEYKKDKMIEKLTLDYTKADMKEIKQKGIMTFQSGEGDKVSLKKSAELLESQGYKKEGSKK